MSSKTQPEPGNSDKNEHETEKNSTNLKSDPRSIPGHKPKPESEP